MPTKREYITIPETEIAPTFNARAVVDRPLAVVDGVNTASPVTWYVGPDAKWASEGPLKTRPPQPPDPHDRRGQGGGLVGDVVPEARQQKHAVGCAA